MRILIVEDEVRAAKRLNRLVREILGDNIKSLKTVMTLGEAHEAIAQDTIDLLFLDLNLNGRDGFETLKTTISESFHTIIVSAYRDEAIKAFDYGILDFVPKPVDEERLAKALQRFKAASANTNDTTTKYLAVKGYGNVELISVSDVLYFQGADIYTEIHLKDGSEKLYEKTLDKLQSLLSKHFFRIHRSYIVQIDQIAKLNATSGSRYSVELKNGKSLPVGRTKVADLRKRLFD